MGVWGVGGGLLFTKIDSVTSPSGSFARSICKGKYAFCGRGGIHSFCCIMASSSGLMIVASTCHAGCPVGVIVSVGV